MNKVNIQRSKLLDDGMLHIEFLDGNSYLYSLQEISDIISTQQSVQATELWNCPNGDARAIKSTYSACPICGMPRT